MNKYYTPDIEEFHSGFEYEILTLKLKDNKTIREWKKVDKLHPELELLLNDKNIRVKYLDREDIESLGFEYEDTLYVKSNVRGDFEYWIDIEREVENEGLEISIDGEDNENNFRGIVKNKSELKKLLTQLRINE